MSVNGENTGSHIVVPRTFYNPYTKQRPYKNNSASFAVENTSLLKSGTDIVRRSSSNPTTYSYVTEVEEFRFIAPKCLDVTQDPEPSDSSEYVPLGTHIGTIKRNPLVYFNGESIEFLNYETAADKLWPIRTKHWAGNWYGYEDFDPRFTRFHVYDAIETIESARNAEKRDSTRFLNLLNPSGTIITLLGGTTCGKRVAVHVYGVWPYFYMEKRATDEACGCRTPRDLIDRLVECVDRPTGNTANSDNQKAGLNTDWRYKGRCTSITSFDVDIVRKRDIYFYGTEETEFYRIKTKNSKHMQILADNFCPSVTKYESNVDAFTRFVLDNEGFVSFGWYCFKNGANGERVQIRHPKYHTTSCDVEINCTVDNLCSESNDDSWPDCYKLMCFDIECKAGGFNEMTFPISENEEDVVIQISCILYSIAAKRLDRVLLFSLGSCDLPETCISHVENACGRKPEVFEFDSEFEMLLAFVTFLKQYAPEFVTGYNIINFDWMYLYEKLSNVYNIKLDGYGYANRNGTFRVWDVGSNGFQKRSKAKINGIISLDMYAILTDKLRLSSYKLDIVAEAVLGEKKKDLAYKDIPWHYAAGPGKRGIIGEYCIQDSMLVGKLFFRYMAHLELSAVAKLAGILISRAIYDGQQIRVYTCILRLAVNRGFILPDKRKRFNDLCDINKITDVGDHDVEAESDNEDGISNKDACHSSEQLNCGTSETKKTCGGRAVGYHGATVLEPVTGFHVDPVMVMDFASLYPTIIQAHNLCFTTMTTNEQILSELRENEDYISWTVLGKNVFFVKKHIRESLLSVLLDDWLAMRKGIRRKMADCTNDDEITLLDKQQAAIKVVCNSVYGFCGASNGILPCLDVAATVTTIGRNMLIQVKDYIHTNWESKETLLLQFPTLSSVPRSTQPGSYSCHVIYGDTDSLFIKFRDLDIDRLVEAGPAMASAVTTALFPPPIKLECEKTFARLLLITKKKYIGQIHKGKMLMKGVNLVRRSDCRFINEYSRKLVNLLFSDEAVAIAAAEIAKVDPLVWMTSPLPSGMKAFEDVLVDAYQKLACPNADLAVEDFVMSAELSRHPSMYANKRIPHLTIYYKLCMRSEREPAVKERISYVIAEPDEPIIRDAEMVARLRGDNQVTGFRHANGTEESCTSRKRKLLISDLAEDPKYVTEKKARLSTDYYFSHLIGSLTVTFKALFGNNTRITEHVLKRFIPETVTEDGEEARRMGKACFQRLNLGWGAFNPDPDVLGEQSHQTLSKVLRTLTKVHHRY